MYRYCLLGAIALATPAFAQDAASQPDKDIIVTGERSDGYRAIDSNALGINLDLRELPATVNVITDEFIKDSGARKLADIIAYTPGVVNNETAGSTAEYFLVRGFATSFVYLNGVRQIYNNARRGLATVDRVEIVKGPAGAESGIADPGGTVNVITRKPLSIFAASLDAGVGDYHYRTISGDVTGPVAFGGKLQARLIAGYQEDVSWRPGQRDHMPFLTIAPSVKLDYAPGGSVYVEYEHDYAKEFYDRGVLHLAGYYPGGFGPRDTSSVNTPFDYSVGRTDRVELGLDQKLGPFTATLRYQHVDQALPGAQLDAEPASGDIYQDDGITWNGTGYTIPLSYSYNPDYKGNTTNYSASLSADFTLAGIRNTVLGGYDHVYNRVGGLIVIPQVSNVLDIRHPDNDQVPHVIGGADLFDQDNIDRVNSWYVKWVARFGDRFRIVAGGRWDDILQFFSYTYAPQVGDFEGGDSTLTDHLFSYRTAASFDVTRAATAFVGYSNAYIPQSGVSRAGPIPALRARSLEAGVKLSLAGGRALWTNTFYSIRQDNQTISDPTNKAFESFLILFGAVRVRGFESELTGRVLPGLDLGAGVSVLQSRIVQANDGTQGNRFLNVPAIQASAFASYNLAALQLKPLTARLGFNALGNRQGNTLNTFRLPGYVRVDAGLGYAVTDRLSARVNVENLFDKTYYIAADQGGLGGGTVSVGNRRLIQAGLGYSF